ncbi:MAG: tetratricopeptide repeat protein [Acidobacteria bacterium]|nr:tetratricopeptide repeat protein [Acidobacteriota bacterium]
MKRHYLLALLSVLLGFLSFTVQIAAQSTDLGRIDFPTSGAAEAREHFLRGVLLLHSFEYDDAREEFRKASKLDPGFAMAFWGESMTYTHPLWNQQDLEGGKAALLRLASTSEARLAKAPTEREKDFLRAVEILYGEGDRNSRTRAYADSMAQVHARYPDDLEAAAFYALSILGTCTEGRDIPAYMKAGAIAEEVYEKNRQHPGALHYMIHSYDDPVHAPLGLRPARIYAKVAPAAAHALHMPSHIFIPMGMWDEAAASNEASFAAGEERVRRKALRSDQRNYHALWWLEYGYLQQGRYRDARGLLAMVEEDAKKIGSRTTRVHLGYMAAAYAIETRQWNALSAAADTSGLGLTSAGINLFARGMAAVKQGNFEAASKVLSELWVRRKAEAGLHSPHAGHHGASSPQSSSDTQAVEVMEKELEALLRLKEGKPGEALALMQDATRIEESMSFDVGPPTIVKPSHELLGEMLLELGRPAEARVQFEAALARAPKRALSLLGLARAASGAGDRAAANECYAELKRVWHRADPDVSALKEIAAVSH